MHSQELIVLPQGIMQRSHQCCGMSFCPCANKRLSMLLFTKDLSAALATSTHISACLVGLQQVHTLYMGLKPGRTLRQWA